MKKTRSIRFVPLRVLLALMFAATGTAVLASDFHFQSPSGNIRCVIAGTAEGVARCDLGVDRQSYAEAPADCDGEWGISFGLGKTGAGFVNCVTDAISPTRQPKVLPYGGRLAYRGLSCRSELAGMTCTNPDGGGFALRRSQQRVF